MDQFGVGLNGTRTDYGIPRCAFDERYISGGSTSGGGAFASAGSSFAASGAGGYCGQTAGRWLEIKRWLLAREGVCLN